MVSPTHKVIDRVYGKFDVIFNIIKRITIYYIDSC